MRSVTTAGLPLAAALILSGTAALGQAPAPPSPQDAHYATFMSTDSVLCYDREKREALPPELAVSVCRKALAALETRRAALKNPKPYEAANFEFRQVLLLSGLGAAFASRDRAASPDTCNAIEQMWPLTLHLKSLSVGDVDAKWHAAYDKLSGSMIQVVTLCRETHGTPAGAIPLPPALD